MPENEVFGQAVGGVRKYYLSGRKLVTIYTSVLILLFKNISYFNIKIATYG